MFFKTYFLFLSPSTFTLLLVLYCFMSKIKNPIWDIIARRQQLLEVPLIWSSLHILKCLNIAYVACNIVFMYTILWTERNVFIFTFTTSHDAMLVLFHVSFFNMSVLNCKEMPISILCIWGHGWSLLGLALTILCKMHVKYVD